MLVVFADLFRVNDCYRFLILSKLEYDSSFLTSDLVIQTQVLAAPKRTYQENFIHVHCESVTYMDLKNCTTCDVHRNRGWPPITSTEKHIIFNKWMPFSNIHLRITRTGRSS
jgi:hypothetical protein